MSEIIGLLLRHVLTGVGAVLVTRGLDPTEASTIVGAVSIVGGLVWSYVQKKIAARKAQ